VRDLDILGRIAKDSWANVTFSITTANPVLAKFLEPNADSSQARFDAIAAIKAKNKNILTGVAAIPMVPGIEDTDENIQQLVENAVKSKADYFIFSTQQKNTKGPTDPKKPI
jgi:DNA repair photolyase